MMKSKILIISLLVATCLLTLNTPSAASAATAVTQPKAKVDKQKVDKYNSLIWDRKDSGDWYEWWYFKVIDPQTNQAYFFTYGLVNPWDSSHKSTASKSFVSVGSFENHSLIQEDFAPEKFLASKKTGDFSIANLNALSASGFKGNIQDLKGHKVSWDFTTVKDWTYDAMGWTMPIKDLSNIYWYPAQASLRMTGWLNFDGRRFEVKDALGYQDRNWGRSFPKWWTWLASNDFENSPGTVLAAGGGNPTVANFFDKVEGFTLGLRHKGHEYKFRLPDGDPIKMNIRYGHWEVDASNGDNERVVLNAFAPKEAFMILPFMTPQGRIFKDYEALLGRITVEIYTRPHSFASWELIDTVVTHRGGIEYGSFDDQKFEELYSAEVSVL